jgi:hypothetical protein
MFGIKSALASAAIAASAWVLATAVAHATVFNPATDPIPGPPQDTLYTYTVIPNTFAQSRYSDDFNGDVGSNNSANVGAVLSTSVWFGVPLTFVSGGNCGGSGVSCTTNANSGSVGGSSGSATTAGANVFAVHFDGQYLAFLYNAGIADFSISGLSQGVSTILSFCSLNSCEPPDNAPPPAPDGTPIPGAAGLMGSVLALGAGFGAWRRRRKNGTAAA